MANENLYIVQFNVESKQLSLVKIENAKELENFQFETPNGSEGSNIKVKSAFIHPTTKKTSHPVDLVLQKPSQNVFNKNLLGNYYNSVAYSHEDFAPAGWHVPTQSELDALILATSNNYYAGALLAKPSLLYWYDLGSEWIKNTFGTTIGAGIVNYSGNIIFLQEFGYYASKTQVDETSNKALRIQFASNTVLITNILKRQFSTVRLIKDDSNFISTLSDIDGNVYNCAKAGDIVFTLENFKCTKLNTGVSLTHCPVDNIDSDIDTPCYKDGNLFYDLYVASNS